MLLKNKYYIWDNGFSNWFIWDYMVVRGSVQSRYDALVTKSLDIFLLRMLKEKKKSYASFNSQKLSYMESDKHIIMTNYLSSFNFFYSIVISSLWYSEFWSSLTNRDFLSHVAESKSPTREKRRIYWQLSYTLQM